MRLPGHINGPEMEAACLKLQPESCPHNGHVSCHVSRCLFGTKKLDYIFFVFICLSLLFVCGLLYRVYSRIGADQSINQSINQS